MRDAISIFPEEDLERLFSVFSCPKNSDVESFLQTKAIRFEKSHNARTHLIVDTDDSSLLAYFSLTFKEVVLPEALSGTQVKKLDGISKRATNIRAYLIGQLAKNQAITGNELCLRDIMDFAYSVIEKAWLSVGGRIILIECEDNIRLLDHYQEHGFERLQKDGDLVQLYQLFDPQQ